jgi:RNA exonuclease 1
VKGLSRRQKRNRNKAKASKKDQQQQTHPKQIQPKQLSQARKQNTKQKSKAEQCPRKETPLSCYSNLKMNKSELYDYLSFYVLSKEKLLESGYPVESDVDPGRVIILKGPETSISYYRTDPPRASQDQKEAYEMGDHYSRGNRESGNLSEKPPLSPSLSKRCVRCNQEFFVTVDGEYLTEESCSYHWGTKKCNRPTGDKKYTCCGKEPNSPGCSTGKLHVWNGVSPGLNGPFIDYVRTSSNGNPRAIYALDCEMCYTGLGLQVCKVTVVGIDGCQVYEALVKPELEVVDYNTRFSGIDERALLGTTKRLRDVQNDLTSFISAETILIGHGLENDLRSLRLLHSRVIDTAVLFPRFQNDIPFRRSLKSLVSDYLHREIQTGPNGHDSFEDARACAELILWKVMKDSTPPVQCI